MENTTIDWTDQSVQRPIPKHVTFVTSTPLQPQVEDVVDNKILAVPLPQEASTSHKQMVSGQEQSTINIIANEFRKLNPLNYKNLKVGLHHQPNYFYLAGSRRLNLLLKTETSRRVKVFNW